MLLFLLYPFFEPFIIILLSLQVSVRPDLFLFGHSFIIQVHPDALLEVIFVNARDHYPPICVKESGQAFKFAKFIGCREL